MLKYELIKIFSKRINRVVLAVTLFIAVISSCFAIGSLRYTDEEGKIIRESRQERLLAADINQWQGELTPG